MSIYLEGRIRGALNYEERSYLADRMIKKLDGKIVTESRDNDILQYMHIHPILKVI